MVNVSPTPLSTPAEHYWPGAPISLPLPDNGVSLSFSNEFVAYLPYGVNRLWYEADGPGFDLARPAVVGPLNGLDVLWHIIGDGKWVDIWCQGTSNTGGVSIQLWEGTPDQSSWAWAEIPNDGTYYGNASNGHAVSGGGGPDATAGLRVYLKAGYHYVLAVSAGYGINLLPDPTAKYYPFGVYMQDFYLEMSYTPLVLPDLKTNALDVIIPRAGATYTSPNVLNTGFTSSAEDPEGVGSIWSTAWWKYTPIADCAVTVDWAVVPAVATTFLCTVYRQQPDGSLIFLANGTVGQFTVPAIHAGDVLYFQIGGTNYYNQWDGYNQPWAQKYQLQVTGAKSLVQAPDTNLGPPNDLRAHATAVSISADDHTYLSDDTTLTYATPGAVGAGPPWPTGSDGRYADDPEASPLYQTAWWSYDPVIAGSATLRAHSNPADDPDAQVMVLDANLALIDVKAMSQDLVFAVVGNATYYLVLGTTEPGVSLAGSFSLVGPPTPGTPPINDARANAITVTVASDGDTYLATNTQLDYATPATAAAGNISGPDQEASGLYQTAWWVYRPQSDGQVQIRAHSNPANNALVKLMVLHSLTPLTTVAMSTDYTHTVTAGETYYYVLGTTGQAFVSASFVLTGTATLYTPPSGPWKLNLLMPDRTWKTLISGTT